MYYEDFFNEPSESDLAIEELKAHLRNEVKEEILNKLNSLKEENEMLLDIKNNWDKLKREYEDKISELECERKKALKDARNECYNATLQDLFDNCELFSKIYQVDYTFENAPKCSKCDNEGKYTLISPDGEEHKVSCSCRKSYKVYKIQNTDNVNIYIQKNEHTKTFYFKINKKDTYDYGYEISKDNIFEKAEEAPNNLYPIFFTTKEEAEKYCNIRNEQIRKEIQKERKENQNDL